MDAKEVSKQDQSGVNCGVCKLKQSKYSCPRCNIKYCSVECYRDEKHVRCSEDFYKDFVLEELQDFHASEDEKNAMLEALSREGKCQAEDEENQGHSLDLEKRMAGLNLERDSEVVWSQLTEEEKKKFQSMLEDGSAGRLVEPWQPWWTQKDNSLVEEVGSEKKYKKVCPPLVKKMPDISKMKSSESIVYNLVNILSGFVYVCRLHNGEHLDLPQEAVQMVNTVSGSLGNTNFSNLKDALFACLTSLPKDQRLESGNWWLLVVEDVMAILSGPSSRDPLYYVLAGLSDLHCLIAKAKKSLEQEMTDKDNSSYSALKAQKQKYFAQKKKIEYLISWTKEYGEQLKDMIPLLQIELCKLTADADQHKKDKETLESAWGGQRPPPPKILVEDITTSQEHP